MSGSIFLLFHPVYIQSPRLPGLERRPRSWGPDSICDQQQIIPNFHCSPNLARFVLGLKANHANPHWGSLIPPGVWFLRGFKSPGTMRWTEGHLLHITVCGGYTSPGRSIITSQHLSFFSFFFLPIGKKIPGARWRRHVTSPAPIHYLVYYKYYMSMM